MRPLALKIQAILENLSPMHIATTRTYNYRNTRVKASEPYPLGQNLRGALGYIFLEMGSRISETFGNGHPLIFFRDALVLHHDGVFEPKIKLGKGTQVTYECNNCLFETSSPTFREPMVGISLGLGGAAKNMFLTDVISSHSKFRFEAIFNLRAKNSEGEQRTQDYLGEFIAALKNIEENGLYIGKRNSKGMGKTRIRNLSCTKITMEDVKKRADQITQIAKDRDGKLTIRLLSDTISRFPIQGEDIAREAKNASKFFLGNAQYSDPGITLIDRPVRLPASASFLDFKQSNGKARFSQENFLISRGTRFTYQITQASHEFYTALAMAEMLRGIGDRTSFGKGEFAIM